MNIDVQEIQKFSSAAHHWWDPKAAFRPLHEINPLRLMWIDSIASLAGKRVLDVGCGGGILSETMAKKGAQVTGIDLSDEALEVAELHSLASGICVHYQKIAAEQLAMTKPGQYDVVTCMEMLEHVPDPAAIIKACATLVKPRGHVFFSTLHRCLKGYLFAVLGAEYLLNLLPKGTHDYAKFITPAELAHYARRAGLTLSSFRGIQYHPFTKIYTLCQDVSVNYLVACTRQH